MIKLNSTVWGALYVQLSFNKSMVRQGTLRSTQGHWGGRAQYQVEPHLVGRGYGVLGVLTCFQNAQGVKSKRQNRIRHGLEALL